MWEGSGRMKNIYDYLDRLIKLFDEQDVLLDSEDLADDEESAEILFQATGAGVQVFQDVAASIVRKLWMEKKLHVDGECSDGYILYRGTFLYINKISGDNSECYQLCKVDETETADIPQENCLELTGELTLEEVFLQGGDDWAEILENMYDVTISREMGRSDSATLEGRHISTTYGERDGNWKELGEIYYQLAILKDEYIHYDMVLANEMSIWQQALAYMEKDKLYPEVNLLLKDYICDKMKEAVSEKVVEKYQC